MKLCEVSVRTPRAAADRVEALLNLANPLAVTFDDAADAPLYEPTPGEMPLWPNVVIHGLFAADFDSAAFVEILRTAVPEIAAAEIRPINEPDWRGGLEQTVFVQRVAENLCVVPADWDQPVNADTIVRLHMGLAFGTGRHPTTLLCLEWLAANTPADATVCDLGCGSGVLAIAALRLGAAEAFAIDIEPQALTATRANAQLNNVAAQLRAGEPGDFGMLQADIVLANILAGTLTESVDAIAAMLRPGGRIVMSGILERQIADVEAAFSESFGSFDIAVRDGWARISSEYQR